jgi:hypothetical protein
MPLCGNGNTLGRWFGVQVLEEVGCFPLVLRIDLYFEFFDITYMYIMHTKMQPVESLCLDVNRTKFGFIYNEDIPDFVLMLNL